jgi:alpha-galactosidase
VGSAVLPPERQGEAAHRFVLGTYRLQKWLKETYPDCFLENCAGGGGRYDLGMMKFSSMIWTSDNTIPQNRVKIQYGSLLAYPSATMSCHVSNRKGICEDEKQLKFRGDVALAGALGFELHLPNASDDLRSGISKQIEFYRKHEKLILEGEYYPVASPFDNNYSAYYYTDEAKNEILLSFIQFAPATKKTAPVPVLYADEDAVYTDEIGKEYTGRELARGIEFICDDSDHNSVVLYLKKS